jgi:hypothetical protein
VSCIPVLSCCCHDRHMSSAMRHAAHYPNMRWQSVLSGMHLLHGRKGANQPTSQRQVRNFWAGRLRPASEHSMHAGHGATFASPCHERTLVALLFAHALTSKTCQDQIFRTNLREGVANKHPAAAATSCDSDCARAGLLWRVTCLHAGDPPGAPVLLCSTCCLPWRQGMLSGMSIRQHVPRPLTLRRALTLGPRQRQEGSLLVR